MSYKVYTHNQLQGGGGACGYYRMLLPLAMMEKLGLPIESIIDMQDMMVDPKVRMSLFLESDFTLIYQQLSEATHNQMMVAKGWKAEVNRLGQVHWPPTFVVDTDDDLFNVMPLNASYKSLGTKRWTYNDPEGVLCEDGDEIGIAHPQEPAPADVQSWLEANSDHPLPGTKLDHNGLRWVFAEDGRWYQYFGLWKDGDNVNFSRNREKMENWRNILKAANLVTCTTDKCAKYVKREIGEDANVFVTPNAIDFAAYPLIELRDHPGKVRILWEGSACHHEGLWPLNDAIARVAKKYPETEWVFFGAPYRWAFRNIDKDQLTHIPWCHYEAYKLRLGTIGHDITLAPLAPTIFNQSRSAIRWYESSAIWKPAATLAQKTAAFEDEIQDGETGMLFNTPEEFEEKLSALIESEKLRQDLASNAKDWVRTHREAGKVATALFMKWVEVREGHKRTIPLGDSVTNAEPVFQ